MEPGSIAIAQYFVQLGETARNLQAERNGLFYACGDCRSAEVLVGAIIGAALRKEPESTAVWPGPAVAH
jgi:hypothetical protein